MYPDLSYIVGDLFGTPVDGGLSIVKTFGLLLVCAFLGSAYVLKLELRRKTAEGLLKGVEVQTGSSSGWMEWLSNAFFAFILGYKLPYIFAHFDEMKADPAGVLLSTKGHMAVGLVLLGLAVAYTWYKRQQEQSGATASKRMIMPEERVGDITMMAALFGILGARLFVIFESKDAFNAFLAHPVETLLSGSGLTIYGGLIVAFLAVYFYVKRIGIKPIHIMDAAAPAIVVGYAIGRIGCQLSGDGDWGIVNLDPPPAWWFVPDWLWAYDYPNTVLQYVSPDTGNSLEAISDCSGYVNAEGGRPIYCNKLAKTVFPTPIYETAANAVIFLILWALRTRMKIAGMMFFTYLLFASVQRYFIEKIRVNDKIFIGETAWTQAELISILLFVVGCIGIGVLLSRGSHEERLPH